MFYDDERGNRYFSLSARPASARNAHVYRMEEGLDRKITSALRIVFPVAALGLAVTIAASLLPDGSSPGNRTMVILCASGLAAVTAFGELGMFLRIRGARTDRLGGRDREALPALRLARGPSWRAYAAFLFALATPLVGLLGLPDDGPASGGTPDGAAGSSFLHAQILVVSAALGLVVAWRILLIVRHRDAT